MTKIISSSFLVLYWIAFVYGIPSAINETTSSGNKIPESTVYDSYMITKRLAERADSCEPGEYPYHVSIQHEGRHSCGGALISATHVLTAGHCVHRFIFDPSTNPQGVTIEIGSVNIGQGYTHRVRRFAQSKGFTMEPNLPYFIPNDIGVITLETPVSFFSGVKTIRLPQPFSDIPSNSKVTITGFGASVFNGKASTSLKQTDLFTISTKDCNKFYTENEKLQITNDHICAKREPGYGTCKGDSGGPLMHDRRVVGVVSGGTRTCEKGDPNVFTKVSHYINFIQHEMQNPTGSDDISDAVDIGGESGDFFVPQVALIPIIVE